MTSANFDRALEEVARMPTSEVNEMLVRELADLRRQSAIKDLFYEELILSLESSLQMNIHLRAKEEWDLIKHYRNVIAKAKEQMS